MYFFLPFSTQHIYAGNKKYADMPILWSLTLWRFLRDTLRQKYIQNVRDQKNTEVGMLQMVLSAFHLLEFRHLLSSPNQGTLGNILAICPEGSCNRDNAQLIRK